MKHTEQRWMRRDDGHMTERDFIPTPAFAADYELVTVTWDEPEYEVKTESRWVLVHHEKGSIYDNKVFDTCPKWIPSDYSPQEITISIRRRKPEPEPVEAYANSDGLVVVKNSEWIGKRVRIEVIS